MDPLSGVLSLLKPQNTMCGGFDVGGEWSLQFPQHEGSRTPAIPSRSSRDRSATNPRALSAPPSSASWAVRRGNTAAAGTWLFLVPLDELTLQENLARRVAPTNCIGIGSPNDLGIFKFTHLKEM